MSWLRQALATAADGRAKLIAGEAFPQMNDAAALAELGKYLNGERGESALRVIEAVTDPTVRAQLGLFSSPPYQRHSPTSIDAATSIEPAAGTLRAAVLAAIRSSPDGMTDEELQVALAMNPSTQRPRRIELHQVGLIVDSGRTRPTAAGRKAVVWVARS